jgi:hypothetical protein
MRSVYFSSTEDDQAEAQELGFGFILDRDCPAPFALIQGPATGDVVLLSPVDQDAAVAAVVQNAAMEAQLALDDVRAELVARIRATLADTDSWCARQVEDGISLTAARKAYRAELRDLIDEVAAMDESDLQTFVIPAAPAWDAP